MQTLRNKHIYHLNFEILFMVSTFKFLSSILRYMCYFSYIHPLCHINNNKMQHSYLNFTKCVPVALYCLSSPFVPSPDAGNHQSILNFLEAMFELFLLGFEIIIIFTLFPPSLQSFHILSYNTLFSLSNPWPLLSLIVVTHTQVYT